MRFTFCGLSIPLVLLGLALVVATPAMADIYTNTTWNVDFNVNGDNLDVVATLGAKVSNSDYYYITALSGTDVTDGKAISLDVSSVLHTDIAGDPPANTDNLFNPTAVLTNSPPVLDYNGLAYVEAGDPQAYAFYYDNTLSQYEGCWAETCTPTVQHPVPHFFVVSSPVFTPTPEPSLLFPLGGAISACLFLFRRKLSRAGGSLQR